VPYVKVLSKPELLKPADLWDLPVQVIAMPWIARSSLMASLDMEASNTGEVFSNIEARISELVEGWLNEVDPALPTILTAHASVQGATFGSERMVMLGSDLVLPVSLVKDPRLDYTALGHIHKPQDVNQGAHPPVIYPGSIERVDFGEAADDRFFIVADVARGKTEVEWRKLTGARPFIDRRSILTTADNVMETLKEALPRPEDMQGAIVRLVVDYPRQLETLIDEPELRKYTGDTFEFHLVKRPQIESRIRLPADQTVSSLTPLDLLDQYWKALHYEDAGNIEALRKLAREIIEEDNKSL
jgi:exonuclease SbcD